MLRPCLCQNVVMYLIFPNYAYKRAHCQMFIYTGVHHHSYDTKQNEGKLNFPVGDFLKPILSARLVSDVTST